MDRTTNTRIRLVAFTTTVFACDLPPGQEADSLLETSSINTETGEFSDQESFPLEHGHVQTNNSTTKPEENKLGREDLGRLQEGQADDIIPLSDDEFIVDIPVYDHPPASYWPNSETRAQYRVAFHVFQKNTGHGNYTEGDRDELIRILRSVNDAYRPGRSKYSDPVHGAETEPENTKIEFSLGPEGSERIYFHRSDALFDSTTQYDLENYVRQNGFWENDVLNIFFTEGVQLGAGGKQVPGKTNRPSFSNMTRKNSIVMMRRFSDAHRRPWVVKATLAHELGHTLDLTHTYQGGGSNAECDEGKSSRWLEEEFLWDVFGKPGEDNCPHLSCWEGADKFERDRCTNNLMGGGQGAGPVSNRQAGRMWRAIKESSSQQYIEPRAPQVDQCWEIRRWSDEPNFPVGEKAILGHADCTKTPRGKAWAKVSDLDLLVSLTDPHVSNYYLNKNLSFNHRFDTEGLPVVGTHHGAGQWLKLWSPLQDALHATQRVRLRSSETNQCLFDDGVAFSRNSQHWDCTDNRNQEWSLDSFRGHGVYRLKSTKTSRCLYSTSRGAGEQLYTASCGDSATALFSLENQGIFGNVHVLRNRATDQCIQLVGGNDGATVEGDCNDSKSRILVDVIEDPEKCTRTAVAVGPTPWRIPDNRSSGIQSTLQVEDDGTVGVLSVNLEIRHPWKGDLLVKLISPEGTEHILHNRAGSREKDLVIENQTTSTFDGEPMRGKWVLHVSDHASRDIGQLESWSLNLIGSNCLRTCGVKAKWGGYANWTNQDLETDNDYFGNDILRYRIRWYGNGKWSRWYSPGEGDIYGDMRYWKFFNTHYHEYEAPFCGTPRSARNGDGEGNGGIN